MPVRAPSPPHAGSGTGAGPYPPWEKPCSAACRSGRRAGAPPLFQAAGPDASFLTSGAPVVTAVLPGARQDPMARYSAVRTIRSRSAKEARSSCTAPLSPSRLMASSVRRTAVITARWRSEGMMISR